VLSDEEWDETTAGWTDRQVAENAVRLLEHLGTAASEAEVTDRARALQRRLAASERQPEVVHLYHARFPRGEEFGLYRERGDAEAMASAGGAILSEVLSMHVIEPARQPGARAVTR
jgi:hypothetical protein